MAAVQRDFGRLFGYAALSDLGVLLLAFAVGGSQRVELTLLHAVGRSVSVILFAASLAILRHRAATDRFSGLHGMARRLPIATVGLMLGGLALAGFPLTAGFPVHWTVYRAASGEEWIWTALLLASSIGIGVGVLRGLGAMLGNEPRQNVDRQPAIASLIVLTLIVLTLVLGLYPQLLLNPVRSAAQAFSLF
jgi:formate hydrogenlyase subunit 3/multisubunit Na+/H+ antiporter MnhD subunit